MFPYAPGMICDWGMVSGTVLLILMEYEWEIDGFLSTMKFTRDNETYGIWDLVIVGFYRISNVAREFELEVDMR